MKITITGKRSEGKSILAIILCKLLQKYTSYNVSLTEEPSPTKTCKAKFKVKAMKQLQPRKVDIVVPFN